MKQFRGIYGILTAPFEDNTLDLDLESVKTQVDYCVKGGSHGIVVPVNASEFFVLSDEERKALVRTAVEHNAGRLPIIVGVTTNSWHASADLARHAKEVGADAVIAAPPTVPAGPKHNELLEYYKNIAGAAELPVFIQNHTPPLGFPLSAETCIDIIRKVDGVNYVKEETLFSGQVITQLNEMGKEMPDRYYGVMGGKACRYLIDEYNRGACGCMPACEIVDVMSQVWDLLEVGEKEKAEELYNSALQLLAMEFTYGYAIYKEVLYRRGIIKSAVTRSSGGYRLDEKDHEELTRVLKPLSRHFKV